MNSRRLSRAVRPLVVAVTASALVLSGCAAVTTTYNVAADDPCHNERSELKSYQDFFVRSMVEGAAIGAATGAIAGALIGGNAQSALIGAGAGALVGGATGYFAAKQKANSGDNAQLTRSVYQDVSAENSQIDNVTSSFRRIKACRLRTANAIRADFAAGRLGESDARSKLQQQQSLFREDINFAEALGSKMNERGAEYANASDEMLKLDPSARQTLAARQAASGTAGGGAAAGAGGPLFVANEAANVRSEPSTNGQRVGGIAPGEAVTVLDGGAATNGWLHVQLKDGVSGYVASRLVRPAGTAAPARVAAASAPPTDTAGVAQLTESNQLKRKALGDEVAEAKTTANTAFELNAPISTVPQTDEERAFAG